MNFRVAKRGKSWQGVVYRGSEVVDGKRRAIRETFTKATKTECTEEAVRRLAFYQKTSAMRFSDWADEWFAARQVKSGTARSYRSIIDIHLKGFFTCSLEDIDERMVMDYYRALRKKGLTDRYIRQHHVVLHRILKDALKRGIIRDDPMLHIETPRFDAKEFNIAGPKTVKLLLSRADEVIRLPILLAIGTGMRIGEVCGLRWKDFEGGYVIIRRQANVSTTKTGNRRAVPLPDFVQQALERSEPQDPEGRVVPVTAVTIEAHFKELTEELGLKLRFHDLRHSYVTALAQAGVNPRVAMELAGHRSLATTLAIYTHVTPQMSDIAASVMDDFLK